MSDTDKPTRTHCWACGHPVEAHDPDEAGLRPCRTPGHPKGLPCAECRRLTSTENRDALQEYRTNFDDETGPHARAWSAYRVTLQDARQAFGESADAFFTDIHQSALTSALIEYDRAKTEAGKHG